MAFILEACCLISGLEALEYVLELCKFFFS